MRTTLLFSVLAGLALLLQPATDPTAAAPPAAAPAVSQGGLTPLPDSAWDHVRAQHLLFRAGFGGSPEEVARLHALGLRKAVDFLVDYRNQPDVIIPAPEGLPVLDPKALAKLNPEERQKLLQQRRKHDAQHIVQLRQWWVKRMVESPRPLEEKLVLFWHGHFATEWRTVRNSEAMALQNQLFREHAAGNFGKLLHAIIHDPAMLRYLDNNTNVKAKPNENLAREIMELFAMGESQGYTEKDIWEGARALTGYFFDPRTLKATFNAAQHDAGDKTIFGKTGKWNGEQFVDLILDQPATPRFIARKLFSYFAHENPSDELLNQLARVLKDNQYELAPFLKTLFLSQEFYSARAHGTQVKSPAQLVIGTIRTLGIKDYDAEALARSLRAMNQDLFEPPNVKGWDGGQTWVNSVTMFARNNFAAALVGRGLEGATARVAKPAKPGKPGKPGEGLPGGPLVRGLDFAETLKDRHLDTLAAVVDYFSRAFYTVPLADARRAELIGFLGSIPPSASWVEQKPEINRRIGALVILMMCLPEYQVA